MRVTLATIAQWLNAEVKNAAAQIEITGVSIDSRTVRPGQLFVAISGENFDGHDFVGAAVKAGAVAVIVSRENALGGNPGVVVPDTVEALGTMAHRYRWQDPVIPWVAVTGSNGKTTTREMIAAILRRRGMICSPEKNYNNLIGLPLTMLNCPDDAWVGVVEMGTSALGEIQRLTEIATPTVSVVTGIARAHLEGLHSIENIAREKSAIYSRLPADGVAIYPASDSQVGILQQAIKGNRASFSSTGAADLVAENIEILEDGMKFTVRGVPFSLMLLGRHNIDNCLAALLAVEHLGVGLKEASEALSSLQPVESRLQLRHAQAGIRVIDDVYNANPASMRLAVETLLELPATRRVAILGDMMELGEQSPMLHAELGRWLSTAGVDVVLIVGKASLSMAETAAGAGARAVVRHFRTVQALMGWLPSTVQENDLILVKGSRGMQMERVVKTLLHLNP